MSLSNGVFLNITIMILPSILSNFHRRKSPRTSPSEVGPFFLTLLTVFCFSKPKTNCVSIGILVKGMYELWGEGTCYEELEDSIKSFPDSRKLPFLTSDSTFRISVETFGKAMTFDEQKDRIHSFTYIPFEVITTLPWILQSLLVPVPLHEHLVI